MIAEPRLPAVLDPSPAVVPATTTTTPPASGSVPLDGSTIAVQSSGEAQVKLACSDVENCTGKLTLTVSAPPGKGKARGTPGPRASLSPTYRSRPAGRRRSRSPSTRPGRALLNAAHGHLGALLTILKSLHPRHRRIPRTCDWCSRWPPRRGTMSKIVCSGPAIIQWSELSW
jgi:hypothetical protein